MIFGQIPTPEKPNLRKNALEAVFKHGEEDERTKEAVGAYFDEIGRVALEEGPIGNALFALTQGEFYLDAGMRENAREALEAADMSLQALEEQTNTYEEALARYKSLKQRLDNPKVN